MAAAWPPEPPLEVMGTEGGGPGGGGAPPAEAGPGLPPSVETSTPYKAGKCLSSCLMKISNLCQEICRNFTTAKSQTKAKMY